MATVTYNGKSTSFGEGNVATLPCNGKVMKSDVVVSGASFMILQYNGNRTQIEEGKTATLPCNGKIMKSDLLVDVNHCKIKVYAEDDSTLLDAFVETQNVTVTVVSAGEGVVLNFSFNGSDSEDYTATYQYSNSTLSGVTDDIQYYRAKYEAGDSFTLEGCKTHTIYLRKMILSYQYYVVFFGLGYVDGVDCRLKNPGTATWADWVNDTDCNTIGAQIIDGHVYTSDGTKILHNSDGTPVNESDIVTLKGEYTFVEV